MNTYTGLHARHYDVVYRDKPYAEEARFVDALLRDAGARPGRLLDVACGTGRHASEFSRLGWNVTGVDLSEELLVLARKNLPSGRFVEQDMRDLELAGERFEAITCLFDAIGYVLDDDGVVAALSACRRHLARDGALVIEFLHAPAMLRDASPLRVRSFDLNGDGDELLRLSRTHVYRERNVMAVEFDLIELRADGTYGRWVEEQKNRFFGVDEFKALLDRAGWAVERAVPAYEPSGDIDDRTFHVIVVAKSPA